MDAASFSTTDRGIPAGGPRGNPAGPPLPSALASILKGQTRVFVQRVDIGALVVRATVQGYIPGKQVSRQHVLLVELHLLAPLDI